VQLAREFGAGVSTTVAGDDAARLARDLGAAETTDYRKEKPDAHVARLTAGAASTP
jgi:NADPH:quinone reductase